MGTIQPNNNPQSRIDVGDHVLEAAKAANTTSLKAKLTAFAKIQSEYAKSHKAALAAEEKLDAAQAAVGEADAVQDAAVMLLAAKMIGDGAPKANPLSIFKLPAPSKLVVVAVEDEVKKTKVLAKQAAAWKSATSGTKAAAAKLGKAAAAVETALKKVAPLQKAHAAAIAKRDALGVPWTRAFAQLKNAARVAEDDGAHGIFEALFGGATTRPSARKTAASSNGSASSQPEAPAPAT